PPPWRPRPASRLASSAPPQWVIRSSAAGTPAPGLAASRACPSWRLLLQSFAELGGQRVGGVVVEAVRLDRARMCPSVERVPVAQEDAEDLRRGPLAVLPEEAVVVRLAAVAAPTEQATDQPGVVVVVFHQAHVAVTAYGASTGVPRPEGGPIIAVPLGNRRTPRPADRAAGSEPFDVAAFRLGESGVANLSQVYW